MNEYELEDILLRVKVLLPFQYDTIKIALKKQVPKKVIDFDEKGTDGYYYLSFICPSCNESVIGQPYRPNNCKHCGQKLDWSDT